MSTIYCSIRLRMILQTEILISMTLLCVPCPVVKEERRRQALRGHRENHTEV
jgi:hypothetical protein